MARIQRQQPCGICMAGEHKKCIAELHSASGNILLCGCPKCFPGKADEAAAEEKATRKKAIDTSEDTEVESEDD